MILYEVMGTKFIYQPTFSGICEQNSNYSELAIAKS